MKVVVDADVQAVLEFMWASVPATRVVRVAQAIPELARLLWTDDPQEPFMAIRLEPSIKKDQENPSHSSAS
jgi:hypothetical protein